jgi:hypothetical protein
VSTVHLAAGDLTTAVGGVSATGIALVLVAVLVYGVIGKGKRKLAAGPAQAVGIFAELAFLRSEGLWLNIGAAVQTIPAGLADNAQLGAPGMAVVCLLLIVLSLFARIVPATGAVLGLLMGAAFAAADGSIWQAIVAIFSVPFGLLGA